MQGSLHYMLNLKPYIRERLFKALEHERPELRAVYSQAVRDLHIGALNEIVMDCLKRYNLSLKCGEISTHQIECQKCHSHFEVCCSRWPESGPRTDDDKSYWIDFGSLLNSTGNSRL